MSSTTMTETTACRTPCSHTAYRWSRCRRCSGTRSVRRRRGLRRRGPRGGGSVLSRRCRVAVRVRQAAAALTLRGLVAPPQCARPQSHSRIGRRGHGHGAALVCPLRDTHDDTRDARHRPDRSGSLADSGRICPLGMPCCMVSCLLQHSRHAGRVIEPGSRMHAIRRRRHHIEVCMQHQALSCVVSKSVCG